MSNNSIYKIVNGNLILLDNKGVEHKLTIYTIENDKIKISSLFSELMSIIKLPSEKSCLKFKYKNQNYIINVYKMINDEYVLSKQFMDIYNLIKISIHQLCPNISRTYFKNNKNYKMKLVAKNVDTNNIYIPMYSEYDNRLFTTDVYPKYMNGFITINDIVFDQAIQNYYQIYKYGTILQLPDCDGNIAKQDNIVDLYATVHWRIGQNTIPSSQFNENFSVCCYFQPGSDLVYNAYNNINWNNKITYLDLSLDTSTSILTASSLSDNLSNLSGFHVIGEAGRNLPTYYDFWLEIYYNV